MENIRFKGTQEIKEKLNDIKKLNKTLRLQTDLCKKQIEQAKENVEMECNSGLLQLLRVKDDLVKLVINTTEHQRNSRGEEDVPVFGSPGNTMNTQFHRSKSAVNLRPVRRSFVLPTVRAKELDDTRVDMVPLHVPLPSSLSVSTSNRIDGMMPNSNHKHNSNSRSPNSTGCETGKMQGEDNHVECSREIDETNKQYYQDDGDKTKLIETNTDTVAIESLMTNPEPTNLSSASTEQHTERVYTQPTDEVSGRKIDESKPAFQNKKINQNECVPHFKGNINSTNEEQHEATTEEGSDCVQSQMVKDGISNLKKLAFKDAKPKLSEQSIIKSKDGSFRINDCADVRIFDKYFVATLKNELVKVEFETGNVSDRVYLKGAGNMCKIRGTKKVAVIQIGKYIAIVDVGKSMQIVYRIKTDKTYQAICHSATYEKYPDNYQPEVAFMFFAVHSTMCGANQYIDTVDKIGPERSQYAKAIRLPNFKGVTLQLQQIRGTTCIDAFGENKLVVGTSKEILCLKKSDDKWSPEWKIPIIKKVSNLVCCKKQVYACIQEEKRVMLIDEEGKILSAKVLNEDVDYVPEMVDVYGDTLAVTSFDFNDWKTIHLRTHI